MYLVFLERVHHNNGGHILLKNKAPKILDGIGQWHLGNCISISAFVSLDCENDNYENTSSSQKYKLSTSFHELLLLDT